MADQSRRSLDRRAFLKILAGAAGATAAGSPERRSGPGRGGSVARSGGAAVGGGRCVGGRQDLRQRLIAGGTELVFPNRRGRHLSIGNIRRRVWYPTLEKASLKPRDLYNARHTFATHALASGEDPGWVAKMLGHTTLSMLVTRYYRYVPNLVRRDGSLLAKQLGRRR